MDPGLMAAIAAAGSAILVKMLDGILARRGNDIADRASLSRAESAFRNSLLADRQAQREEIDDLRRAAAECHRQHEECRRSVAELTKRIEILDQQVLALSTATGHQSEI